jgi:hypothetical protein
MMQGIVLLMLSLPRMSDFALLMLLYLASTAILCMNLFYMIDGSYVGGKEPCVHCIYHITYTTHTLMLDSISAGTIMRPKF